VLDGLWIDALDLMWMTSGSAPDCINPAVVLVSGDVDIILDVPQARAVDGDVHKHSLTSERYAG
jgi:hypothetical protein